MSTAHAPVGAVRCCPHTRILQAKSRQIHNWLDGLPEWKDGHHDRNRGTKYTIGTGSRQITRCMTLCTCHLPLALPLVLPLSSSPSGRRVQVPNLLDGKGCECPLRHICCIQPPANSLARMAINFKDFGALLHVDDLSCPGQERCTPVL